MVLCKPGLHPPTLRKVSGVPSGGSSEKSKEELPSNTTSTETDGCIKKPSGKKLPHFLCPTSLPSVEHFAVFKFPLREPKVIGLRVS